MRLQEVRHPGSFERLPGARHLRHSCCLSGRLGLRHAAAQVYVSVSHAPGVEAAAEDAAQLAADLKCDVVAVGSDALRVRPRQQGQQAEARCLLSTQPALAAKPAVSQASPAQSAAADQIGSPAQLKDTPVKSFAASLARGCAQPVLIIKPHDDRKRAQLVTLHSAAAASASGGGHEKKETSPPHSHGGVGMRKAEHAAERHGSIGKESAMDSPLMRHESTIGRPRQTPLMPAFHLGASAEAGAGGGQRHGPSGSDTLIDSIALDGDVMHRGLRAYINARARIADFFSRTSRPSRTAASPRPVHAPQLSPTARIAAALLQGNPRLAAAWRSG